MAARPPACGSTDEPRIDVRAGLGAAGGVVQRQELTFKRLVVDAPVLILVERGVKTLRWSGGEYIVRAGEAVALAGGQSFDITNRPPESGDYRALWLAFDEDIIAAHAHAHPHLAVIRNALPLPDTAAGSREAFQRASQALGDDSVPAGIARHRVAELLLWVGQAGGRFEQAQSLTMMLKVRRLIGRDLAHPWSAAEVAAAFAVSEPTLRRRLGDEGTSLTAILADARMSLALQLLQSTTRPVTHVAMAVGYQTPSQFSVRFRERFGFAPTALRGHRRPASLVQPWHPPTPMTEPPAARRRGGS